MSNSINQPTQGAKIVPLYNYQPVEVADNREQITLLLNQFEPVLEKIQKIYAITEKAMIETEEKNGYTESVIKMSQALNYFDEVFKRTSKGYLYLQTAFEMMPEWVLDRVFTSVCDNPHLVLPCDFNDWLD